MPDLTTQGQLSRARNWIQGTSIIPIFLFRNSFLLDWKSELDSIQQESTPSSTTTTSSTQNWREIFGYDELNENNKESSLWNEIHRPWWPPPTESAKPSSK